MAKRAAKSKAERQQALADKTRERDAAANVAVVEDTVAAEPVVPDPVVEPEVPLVGQTDVSTEEGNAGELTAEQAGDAEVEAEVDKPNSVVAVKFKEKYLANARERGIPGKAAKRSNWDWLAERLASLCLDDKHKISIDKFKAVLDANGVDHSKWTNRNKGWEGRFRMTGRVALQKVVANNAALKVPDGEDMVPPEQFIQRFKTKE
jgi:hypothetical protein